MPRPRSWTDDQLRDAVSSSTTYREVLERLGLKPGGQHTNIRVRIAELGIDDSHIRAAERKKRTQRERQRREIRAEKRASTRRWSDDDLRRAVARSTSLNQVFSNLGLKVGGSQWLAIQERMAELDIDTSHFEVGVLARKPRRRGRARAWTDEDLRSAVEGARSVAEVLRRLGLRQGGGSHDTVKRRIEQLGLDTSAMKGQGWSRGLRSTVDRGRPLDEILVEDSDYHHTQTLKRRLLRVGYLELRCEICRGDEWQGRPMPLRLDHINGDRRDNRLQNLRLLCANCDAQTDTYCGRNIGRYDDDG